MSGTLPDAPELTATGADAHFRRLEALYRSAPVNRQFESEIEITAPASTVKAMIARTNGFWRRKLSLIVRIPPAMLLSQAYYR